MADLFDVSGKTALVTGGSRGIGLMIARGLLSDSAMLAADAQEIEASKLPVVDSAPGDPSGEGYFADRQFTVGRKPRPRRLAQLTLGPSKANTTKDLPTIKDRAVGGN